MLGLAGLAGLAGFQKSEILISAGIGFAYLETLKTLNPDSPLDSG